jgi:iron complex outermembrane receptor protein
MRSGNLAFCSASLLAIAIMAVLGAAPALAQTPPEETQPDSGEAAPAPQQEPAQAADQPTELDTIVVTGLRRSLQSAQTIKQDSVQIVDSIVAEDIGKLPDITASASLARVTGVQVTRAAGEAADVQVRGLPNPATTYNGREIFTAENRAVALQDFPAGGVAGLDVYKSSTADLVESGIAGLIDVRSRRPFDFEGFEMSGSFNEILADQADSRDINGNFLISNRWQTGVGEMGFLINGAWNRIRFLDSTREESLVMGIAQPAQTDQPGFRFPDAVAVFFGDGMFTRPSVNAAFQWRPNERWEVNADALFQGFRGEGSDRFLFVPLFTGDTQFSNVVLEPGQQADQARSLTATGGLRPEGFQASVDASTDTYQIGLGATYRDGGWRWSSDIAYTDSTFKLKAANVDYAYAGTPVRDVNFDVGGDDGGPTFTLRDFDPRDPANYIFRGLFDRNYEAKGDDLQARTDLEFTPQSGFITAIQGGLRYNERSAERRNGERYQFWEPNGIPLADLPLDFVYSEPGFDGSDHAPLRSWYTPTRDSIRRNIGQLRALVGFPTDDPVMGTIFTADEKAYAAYGQLKYEFDAGFPIDGAVGLRAVRTETEVSGIFDGEPVSPSNSYTDYLPNASMRLRLTDEFQIRVAATRTRSRPNFDQLNPTTTFRPLSGTCVEDPQDPNCVREGDGGNPDLDPLESKNYDLSFEYYFSPAGSATLALFRRDVSGFISNFTVDVPDPVYNIVRITRPENGGDGKLQGVEAAFTTFFDYDFVPEWAKAFGLQANYTYIDNGAELGPTQAASLPGKPRLPGVSKNSYNVVLLYERPVFSARLAYNWRSKWVQEYLQIFDPALGASGPTLPLVQDERGVLDFSMNYTPVPALTFAFDVSNILGDPITNSRQYNAEGDVYPRQVKYLERVWSLGVRFRF